VNDTSPEIVKMVRDRYMQMPGEERFLIGMQMFETARTIALSALPQDATEEDKRRHLCERFYGNLAAKVFPKQSSRHSGLVPESS